MKDFFENFKYTKLYGVYSLFRYNIPQFFKNIWRFKTELYHYRAFDWRYSLSMFRRALEIQSKYTELYGYEIDETRLKKIAKMNRAIEIMKWHEDSSFIELAEKELGFEY